MAAVKVEAREVQAALANVARASRGITNKSLIALSPSLQRKLKSAAPVDTGRLRRSIRVKPLARALKPVIIISGSRALVPQNARTRFMSKEVGAFSDKMRDRMQAEYTKLIKRLFR